MGGGSWVDLDSEEDEAIRQAMLQGHLRFTIQQRGFQYDVDLINMEQRNTATGKTRPLRTSEEAEWPPCEVVDPVAVRPEFPMSTISNPSVANSRSGTSATTSTSSTRPSLLGRLLPSRRKAKTEAKTIGKTAATATSAAAVLGGGAFVGDYLIMDGDFMADDVIGSTGDFVSSIF